MYQCPKSKCKSKNTYKEKILGQDTGDRVCNDCGYITSSASFRIKPVMEMEDQSGLCDLCLRSPCECPDMNEYISKNIEKSDRQERRINKPNS